MVSDVSAAGRQPASGELPGGEDGPQSEAHVSSKSKAAPADANKTTSTLKARKRTKTGCLTCRRRRIKCGEERPTCRNCTKSKRDCEGYNPRVVFKDPVGAFRQAGGIVHRDSLHNPLNLGHSGTPGIFANVSAMSGDAAALPIIAPRPSLIGDQYRNGAIPREAGQYPSANTHLGANYSSLDPPLSASHSDFDLPQYLPHSGNASLHLTGNLNGETFPQCQPPSASYSNFQQQQITHGENGLDPGQLDVPSGWPHSPNSSAVPPTYRPVMYTQAAPSGPTQNRLKRSYSDHHEMISPLSYQETHNVPQGVTPATPSSQIGWAYPMPGEGTPQNVTFPQFPNCIQPRLNPAQSTGQEEEPDDDWFDVDSDDENATTTPDTGEASSWDLGLMIAMSANQNDTYVRSMTDFLNKPNMLSTYHPTYAASPLMDAQTARVFAHFITVTAPTLTVCERHPSHPAVFFSGHPVPRSQRALWSYTLPMLALTHQGLLHAMLAMASLHISKLQQTSSTPSLKHYHYALRRVGKALSNQKKRRDVATLAATLLLGFYEVTTAEHNKWNSHLSGARELVMDIDFAGMARKIEAYRIRQEEVEAMNKNYMLKGFYDQAYLRRPSDDFPARADRKLDENLISTIMGWETRYEQYGHIIDDSEPFPASHEPLTPQAIENFETQCDLFWWYGKQDMYQSIISGNRLLLSYDRWARCPPRAPVGRLDAVYGTMDHLLLLMARLADFAAKDKPRKLRALKEAGRQPRPPSQTPSPQQAPTFFGMMPDPGPVRLPRGFDQAQHDRLYTAPVPSTEKPLDTATREAEAEHAAITHAFDTFHSHFGPSFAPLSPEYMTPMATPFGPALYYRSYSIACVQNLYYCGRIILTRTAPSMPPAAMAAAGIAAPLTAQYANSVGRICAGIQPVSNTVPLNPHHGAALTDVCMGLFHAGVQYRDPAQRGWTIIKLRDTARLTGSQTSLLIAHGCERAWMRAAQMGKGPPYEQIVQGSPGGGDQRAQGREEDPRLKLNAPPRREGDRRFITGSAGTRVHWAMGVLSVEEDMKAMVLNG